jgi:signal transduction histidine kinase/ligand-binding sensor domain-containing protein
MPCFFPRVRCLLLAMVCAGGMSATWGQALSANTDPLDLRYLSHQSWSTEEGLPQSSVHGIAQTKDGFVWAATEGGLARFDGVNFTAFGHAEQQAFKSDDLCCLLAREAGLWVGSSNGLVRRQGDKFQRYGVAEGLASEFVLSLSDGPRGLMVETTGGWSRWDGAKFVAAQNLEPAWKVVDGQLSVRGVARTWKLGEELPAGRVTAVEVDREGSVWVGMSKGLVIADRESGAVKSVDALKGSGVLSVMEDAEGNHWVGTETTGLHVLRRLKFRSEGALAGTPVTVVVQASDGAMWVGSRDDGLRRLRNGVWDEPAKALTSQVVLSMVPSEAGGVWVGTPDGLNLVRSDGNVQRITSAEGLPDETIRSLAVAPDGSVWAGTRRGLVHLRVDAAGRVSVKTLTSMDGLGGDLIGTMLMARGANGGLWVATSQGVSHIAQDGTIASYTAKDGLGDGIVKAIAQGNRGGIWVVTEANLLSRFEDNGFVRALQLEDRENKVEAMVSDGRGSLWLRMDRGVKQILLSEMRPCVANAVCIAKADADGLADGMPNSEVVPEGTSQPWLTTSGELWFPTRGGVAVADTLHLPLNRVPPPVAIERFLIDDVAQPLTDGLIEVKAGRSRLTLEYAGLSFVAPGEVRYRFMLEGFDDHWTDAGVRRVATYTNLPPGKYRFRVIAMNDDGVWSTEGATLSLRVVPPFWRRWWFVAIFVLLVGALLAGLYLLRLRRLRQQFDAVLAERNRMAREIHDTLTQDFVGTSLQLDLLAAHLKSGRIETAIEDVRRTRLLVTEGLEEARRSIWELRANQAGDTLPTRMSNLVDRDRFAAISPQLKVGGAYRVLEARVEREVLRITQEAMANALQHAQASHCWVELQYASDALVLTVRDNGVGFSEEVAARKDGHFGLVGMRERASSIGGTLDIASEPGAGTTVNLRVPLDAGTR